MTISIITPNGHPVEVFFDIDAEAFMAVHADGEVSFGFTIAECTEAYDRDIEKQASTNTPPLAVTPVQAHQLSVIELE